MNIKIILKVILCFLFLVITDYSQNEPAEKDIEQLFNLVNLQDEQKDHIGVVRTLLEILEIDPSNIKAKNQLGSALKSYVKEVIKDEELLYSALHYLGNDIKIPAAPIIVNYYNTNNIDQVRQFISSLYRGNESHFRIPIQDLFEMNHTNNPLLYKEILVLIKPFIYEDEQSEYLFLNLLVEPNNNYLVVLNELDLKTDSLELCSNPSEFPRILDLYYKKNPNPSSATVSAIKNNLSDCLNFNNLAYRAIYYYKNGFWNELNNLINKSLSGSAQFSIGFRELLDIDVNENPTEASRLLKIFTKHLPAEIDYSSFNDTELYNLATKFRFINREDISQKLLKNIKYENYNLVTLYNKKLFEQFDILITKPLDQPLDLKITDFELENFDIYIDTIRARSLFIVLLDDIKKKGFAIYEDEYLYNFAKISHKLKISNNDIFAELVKRIIPSNSFENMIIWSLSSLMTGDQNRAERIINNIESLGSTVDLAYLQLELNWWKTHGIKSNFIDLHLEKLRGFEDKEEEKFFITKTDNPDQISSVTEENYFALLIGIESYQDKTMNLRYPLKDLGRLKEILISDYLFAEKNVFTIANPDRNRFFESFEKIKKQIDQNDNLLIFYAGHGYWDESMEQGYWIPSDATRNDKSNWISNPEIVSLLKSIKPKHTLLVSDACFSGSIFVTRKTLYNNDKSVEIAYSKISKKGMTSGANTPVPDKSVFVEFFLKRLKENESKYLPAEKLYLDFRDAVTNNSLVGQRPLYEVLDGDEGGEFIFIRK
jgi:hypothetical protein